MMKPWFLIFVPIVFVACTYSINMIDTHGSASDVVDETTSNTPSTTLTVPIAPTAV